MPIQEKGKVSQFSQTLESAFKPYLVVWNIRECGVSSRLATCPVQVESNGAGWEAMIGHGPPELGRLGIEVGSGETPTSK